MDAQRPDPPAHFCSLLGSALWASCPCLASPSGDLLKCEPSEDSSLNKEGADRLGLRLGGCSALDAATLTPLHLRHSVTRTEKAAHSQRL